MVCGGRGGREYVRLPGKAIGDGDSPRARRVRPERPAVRRQRVCGPVHPNRKLTDRERGPERMARDRERTRAMPPEIRRYSGAGFHDRPDGKGVTGPRLSGGRTERAMPSPFHRETCRWRSPTRARATGMADFPRGQASGERPFVRRGGGTGRGVPGLTPHGTSRRSPDSHPPDMTASAIIRPPDRARTGHEGRSATRRAASPPSPCLPP